MRLIGPNGTYGYGATLNFGDGNFVYVQEDEDDKLRIHASGRIGLTGGPVGIGTAAPLYPLHMASGVHCTNGGVWTNASSRELKENFRGVDGRAVLDALATLDILQWNYVNEDDGNLHIGPMAEDFAAAFGLGASDKAITTIDADGVALAAIKALREESGRAIAERDERIAAIEAENRRLLDRLEQLEAATQAALGIDTARASDCPHRLMGAEY